MPPEIAQIVSRALPIGLRVGGMMTFAPFYGSETLPASLKAIFTMVVTAMLYGVTPAARVSISAANWLPIVVSEAFVGLMMGLAMQMVFEGMQVGGQLAGMQLGFSLASLIDPQTNIDTPVLAVFYQMFALLIFLQLNVHHWLLQAVFKSFQYIPVGTAVATSAAARNLLQIAGAMWLIGVQVAAPIVLATLLVDVTMGFLNKASPQLPAMFIGISVKNLVGYGVVAASAALWPGFLENEFTRAIGWVEQLLHLAH